MAAVSVGNLFVIGDNQGADIAISQPAVGQITLTGNGTKVNGSTEPVTFSGVTRDLRIYFGRGDDSLTFDETNPIVLSGNLSITGGQGSNTVSTLPGSPGSLKVGGNLSILNLPGPAQLTTLLNLNVKGNVQIANLGGIALVTIDVASAGDALPPSNTIGGNLLITNGPGKFDATDLSSINVKGNLQVLNLGTAASTSIDSFFAGQSTIGGDLQIINGPGQSGDTAIIGTTVGRNLQVLGSGPGRSSIVLASSNVRGATNLRGGNGDDTVFVDDAIFGGDFQLQTGTGADTVNIGTGGDIQRVRFVPEQRVRTVLVVDPITGEVQTLQKVYTVFKPVYETMFLAGGQATFSGKVSAYLGGKDDTLNLAIDAEVRFSKAATLDGQNGQNTANVHTANLPALPTLKRFQINEV